jgi:predicted amidohydrolase
VILQPDAPGSPRGEAPDSVRVALVQYAVRRLDAFEQFSARVEYFVDAARDYEADFVLFPEYFSAELLSLPQLRRLPAGEGIVKLAKMESIYLKLLSELAQRFRIHIVGGGHPMKRGNQLHNMCAVFLPDGRTVLQPKLHITPWEQRSWHIEGGSDLLAIQTPKVTIGINICYDVEFPEVARYLASQGVDLLFVPYCTDTREGYNRVRYCAQARAIENQVYVATAGVTGNLADVANMNTHYARSAVFSPCDFGFARDGIEAEADPNHETLLVVDLDIAKLRRARAEGTVTPALNRRTDLFDLQTHLVPISTAPSSRQTH